MTLSTPGLTTQVGFSVHTFQSLSGMHSRDALPTGSAPCRLSPGLLSPLSGVGGHPLGCGY